MKAKFLVMKIASISGSLDLDEQSLFHKLLRKISGNQKEGHRYIVVNMDEPYIEEVIEVLKRNGHWDEEENV